MWSRSKPDWNFWNRRAMDYGEEVETGTGALTELPDECKRKMMNCYNCESELIWGGDQDIESEEGEPAEEFSMVTNLSCPNCKSFVEVYTPKSFFTKENEE